VVIVYKKLKKTLAKLESEVLQKRLSQWEVGLETPEKNQKNRFFSTKKNPLVLRQGTKWFFWLVRKPCFFCPAKTPKKC